MCLGLLGISYSCPGLARSEVLQSGVLDNPSRPVGSLGLLFPLGDALRSLQPQLRATAQPSRSSCWSMNPLNALTARAGLGMAPISA